MQFLPLHPRKKKTIQGTPLIAFKYIIYYKKIKCGLCDLSPFISQLFIDRQVPRKPRLVGGQGAQIKMRFLSGKPVPNIMTRSLTSVGSIPRKVILNSFAILIIWFLLLSHQTLLLLQKDHLKQQGNLHKQPFVS